MIIFSLFGIQNSTLDLQSSSKKVEYSDTITAENFFARKVIKSIQII